MKQIDKNYGINTKEIIDTLYSIGIRVVFIKTEECIDGLPTIELRATYLKKQGDKIRFKSTGEIEKISTISHGGRFINGVDVNDVEKL